MWWHLPTGRAPSGRCPRPRVSEVAVTVSDGWLGDAQDRAFATKLSYEYDADARDQDEDPVTFHLTSGPPEWPAPRAPAGCSQNTADKTRTGWTCPRPANTPDVGVSPRGGCSDAEEGGGRASGSPTTAIVHAVVQG